MTETKCNDNFLFVLLKDYFNDASCAIDITEYMNVYVHAAQHSMTLNTEAIRKLEVLQSCSKSTNVPWKICLLFPAKQAMV